MHGATRRIGSLPPERVAISTPARQSVLFPFMLPTPANDDGLPIECASCGATGELAVADGALRPSSGFEMLDGMPVCDCGGLVAMRAAHLC